MVQRSSPVTAAGPSPIRTGFPIEFLRTPELWQAKLQALETVNQNFFSLSTRFISPKNHHKTAPTLQCYEIIILFYFQCWIKKPHRATCTPTEKNLKKTICLTFKKNRLNSGHSGCSQELKRELRAIRRQARCCVRGRPLHHVTGDHVGKTQLVEGSVSQKTCPGN